MPRLPNRRTFLRAAAVTGTLLPAGVLAQRLGRSPLPAELLDPAQVGVGGSWPVA